MSKKLLNLLQNHLKNLATDVLDALAEDNIASGPEDAEIFSEEPIEGPEELVTEEPELDSEPEPEEPVEEASEDPPFIHIPDNLAFQLRDLVQEKNQISQGLRFIQQAFTSQAQRIDALYQELRARYEVPKDPHYVLHISEGEGDRSGFQYMERTFPREEPAEEPEDSEEAVESESSDDNSSMNQES